MKNSSYGISKDGVLRGFGRFMGPYSCVFWRMCRAYADCGLLCLMYRACSCSVASSSGWSGPHKPAGRYCK
jgi:hypothetical protein